MTRRAHLLCGSALLALVLLRYAPHVLTAEHVYEDGVWAATRHQALTLDTRLWPKLLWRLTDDPRAHHAVALGLFLACAGLLWRVARALALSAQGASLATALFLLAPVTIEAVAYASALPELFAAVGVLGACLMALRRRWLLASACVLFGLGGKETALVALALIPVLYWATGRLAGRRLLAGAAVTGILSLSVVDLAALANIGEGVGLHTTAAQWARAQSVATVRLLGVAVSGTGMTIDPDIDAYGPVWQLGASAMLVSLVTLAWLTRQSAPLLACGLLWTLVSLAPRFLVQTPRSYLNEHQFITPFIGLTLAGAAAWDRWRPA